MAKAIKCDCCGKFMEISRDFGIVILTREARRYEYDSRNIPMFPPHVENTNVMELCDECDTAIGEVFNARHEAAIASEVITNK